MTPLRPGTVVPGVLLACAALAEVRALEDIGGLPGRREEVFEFIQEPVFKKVGEDNFEIRFALKGRCDVTVGVLDHEGKIVRHLVSGVLGPNAPEPLKKDSLEQCLLWDGKNDLGRYVEQPETCKVRVSLGLKPVFDKVLLWHPNRMNHFVHGIACDAEGVYVWSVEGNGTVTTAHQPPDLSHIQVFDRQGRYRRTLLPLPSQKLQAGRLPAHPMQTNAVPEALPNVPKGPFSGPPFGLTLPDGRTVFAADPNGHFFRTLDPNSFFVADGTLWTIQTSSQLDPQLRFFRLRTDGSMPPEGYYTGPLGRRPGIGPCWTAVSPDRKWIYLSGLGGRIRIANARLPQVSNSWIYNVRDRVEVAEHAVYRVPFDLKEGLAAPFAGEKGKSGKDDAHFSFPEGIACDEQGRVYVSDTGNDRVQVFGPDGKLQKSIPVPSPYLTAVHPKTGALYVLSYPQKLMELHLLKLKSLQDPRVEAEQVFNAKGLGTRFLPTFCLDHASEPAVVWLVAPNSHVQLWEDSGAKFTLRRDLHDDLKKEYPGHILEDEQHSGFHSEFFIGSLAPDTVRPYLYILGHRGSGLLYGRQEKTVRVHVETGQVDIGLGAAVVTPDGLGYVRASEGKGTVVRRCDLDSGQPMAFDYGSGEKGVLNYPFCSGDSIGFGVSPSGMVAYHDRWPPVPGMIKDIHPIELGKQNIPSYMMDEKWAQGKSTSLVGYRMRELYPGRVYAASGALLIFDSSGQLKTNDAVGGLPRVASGVRLDLKGNIYVGLALPRLKDGKEFAGNSLAKFGPEGGRLLVNGPGVKVPLADPPKRPPDFKQMIENSDHGKPYEQGPNGETSFGDKTWGENMHWAFGGYYPFNRNHCVCLNANFDLDLYARSFVPESLRNAVTVIDTNGNFILRLGAYGNCDDRGPEIRFAHCRYVGVNDRRLYINDMVNKRILSVDLKYEAEKTASLR